MSNDDLTDLQLNVLIVVYYAKYGVALNEPSRVDWGDSCKFLVDAGLAHYTGWLRDMIAIRSMSSPMLVEKVPGPTTYTAAAITEEGKRVVEDISIARKVEACIAMEEPDTAKALAGSLSAEELPLLLASEYEFIRDAAKDRLTALGTNAQVEEDSGGKLQGTHKTGYLGNLWGVDFYVSDQVDYGKMYLIDAHGGHITCIKGLVS